MGNRVVDQYLVLLRKNLILSRRNLRASIIQLLAPIVFCFLLWILKIGIEADQSNQEVIKPVTELSYNALSSTVPKCIPGKKQSDCLTMAVAFEAGKTLNDTVKGKVMVDKIVSQMVSDNSWETGKDIRVFDGRKEINAFMLEKRNYTAGAVVFTVNEDPGVTAGPFPGYSVTYTIQYNQTQIYRYGQSINLDVSRALPMQLAVETAIGRIVTGNKDFAFKIRESQFTRPELVSADVVRTAGGTFFFGALMFNVVIQLGQIVYEKERKLREGMRVMGLTDSAYWASWVTTNMILNFFSVWFLILGGYIFQFRFFLDNAFGAFFFLFLLFAWAMVPWVIVLSTLTDRSKTAFSLGFLVFMIGFIAITFGPFVMTESFMKGKYRHLTIIFRLLPFMLLGKGMDDIGSVASTKLSGGFNWNLRFDNSYWSLVDTYNWLIIDFFVWGALGLYMDNIIKGQYGRSKPLWYFLLPSYWRGSPAADTVHKPMPQELARELFKDREVLVQDANGNLSKMIVPFATNDEGVAAEDALVDAGVHTSDSSEISLVIEGLNKTFRRTFMGFPVGAPFYAVRRFNLALPKDKLFCLLGHNGAGKTTLINMLTGLIDPTYGDAHVCGYSIRNQMAQVRSMMGVCPQHDILWDQLTGREHLQIYGALKGLEGERLSAEIQERLKDVTLLDAADVQTGAYSGGMKRRLSTAIAFIADPKIIFLDEPTTGMDPVTRREVWNLIEKKKIGRTIILTTHSMEEADVLSDRIGITAEGRLVTLGTSLRLKNKFGAGYQMTIVLKDDGNLSDEEMQQNAINIIRFIKDNLNGLEPIPQARSRSSIIYIVPRQVLSSLKDLFRNLENLKSKEDNRGSGSSSSSQKSKYPFGIKDIQLQMTSMEEVFIQVSQWGEGVSHGSAHQGFLAQRAQIENMNAQYQQQQQHQQHPNSTQQGKTYM